MRTLLITLLLLPYLAANAQDAIWPKSALTILCKIDTVLQDKILYTLESGQKREILLTRVKAYQRNNYDVTKTTKVYNADTVKLQESPWLYVGKAGRQRTTALNLKLFGAIIGGISPFMQIKTITRTPAGINTDIDNTFVYVTATISGLMIITGHVFDYISASSLKKAEQVANQPIK